MDAAVAMAARVRNSIAYYVSDSRDISAPGKAAGGKDASILVIRGVERQRWRLVQFCSLRPGTRLNSRSLLVTSVNPAHLARCRYWCRAYSGRPSQAPAALWLRILALFGEHVGGQVGQQIQHADHSAGFFGSLTACLFPDLNTRAMAISPPDIHTCNPLRYMASGVSLHQATGSTDSRSPGVGAIESRRSAFQSRWNQSHQPMDGDALGRRRQPQLAWLHSLA